MKGVLCLLWCVVTLATAVDPICLKMSECGADCYTTCDNPCQCDSNDDGEIPFPTYGGQCQDVGFCESDFLHLEDCIEEGGPSCPNTMVWMDELLESYSTYDYRIDVRSVGEWEEGHANISIPTPGLAKNPAANYLDKLAGKEDARILVYCKSGGRAFEASQNLLRYGFSNINSFYQGGFPNLEAAIKKDSEEGSDHPNKNYCYITGGSDICPTPLPLSHIKSKEDVMSLGDNVVLVDVRPKSYKPSLEGAVRFSVSRRTGKYLEAYDKDVHTLVLYCEEGDTAFARAKKVLRKGWKGPLYFVDNGGYAELQRIFDGEEIIGEFYFPLV